MRSVPPASAGGSLGQLAAECLIHPLTRVVLTSYHARLHFFPHLYSFFESKASSFFFPVLIISAEERFMSGRDFQEEAVLAAVKPLKAVDSTSESQRPIGLRQLSLEDSNSLEGLFQRH